MKIRLIRLRRPKNKGSGKRSRVSVLRITLAGGGGGRLKGSPRLRSVLVELVPLVPPRAGDLCGGVPLLPPSHFPILKLIHPYGNLLSSEFWHTHLDRPATVHHEASPAARRSGEDHSAVSGCPSRFAGDRGRGMDPGIRGCVDCAWMVDFRKSVTPGPTLSGSSRGSLTGEVRSRMALDIEALLNRRMEARLAWVEPWPAVAPQGGPIDAHVEMRATVHDCVNLQRVAWEAKGIPHQCRDKDLLLDFIAIHWATVIE